MQQPILLSAAHKAKAAEDPTSQALHELSGASATQLQGLSCSEIEQSTWSAHFSFDGGHSFDGGASSLARAEVELTSSFSLARAEVALTSYRDRSKAGETSSASSGLCSLIAPQLELAVLEVEHALAAT